MRACAPAWHTDTALCQLIKLPKESADGFNMAVCKACDSPLPPHLLLISPVLLQSDKRVVCSPANSSKTECSSKKWVEGTVLCDFNVSGSTTPSITLLC